MSARETIISEIKIAPEPLVQEVYDFILLLKSRGANNDGEGNAQRPSENPDFLARQRALFGKRVLPDSQVILDGLRAERF